MSDDIQVSNIHIPHFRRGPIAHVVYYSEFSFPSSAIGETGDIFLHKPSLSVYIKTRTTARKPQGSWVLGKIGMAHPMTRRYTLKTDIGSMGPIWQADTALDGGSLGHSIVVFFETRALERCKSNNRLRELKKLPGSTQENPIKVD